MYVNKEDCNTKLPGAFLSNYICLCVSLLLLCVILFYMSSFNKNVSVMDNYTSCSRWTQSQGKLITSAHNLKTFLWKLLNYVTNLLNRL